MAENQKKADKLNQTETERVFLNRLSRKPFNPLTSLEDDQENWKAVLDEAREKLSEWSAKTEEEIEKLRLEESNANSELVHGVDTISEEMNELIDGVIPEKDQKLLDGLEKVIGYYRFEEDKEITINDYLRQLQLVSQLVEKKIEKFSAENIQEAKGDVWIESSKLGAFAKTLSPDVAKFPVPKELLTAESIPTNEEVKNFDTFSKKFIQKLKKIEEHADQKHLDRVWSLLKTLRLTLWTQSNVALAELKTKIIQALNLKKKEENKKKEEEIQRRAEEQYTQNDEEKELKREQAAANLEMQMRKLTTQIKYVQNVFLQQQNFIQNNFQKEADLFAQSLSHLERIIESAQREAVRIWGNYFQKRKSGDVSKPSLDYHIPEDLVAEAKKQKKKLDEEQQRTGVDFPELGDAKFSQILRASLNKVFKGEEFARSFGLKSRFQSNKSNCANAESQISPYQKLLGELIHPRFLKYRGWVADHGTGSGKTRSMWVMIVKWFEQASEFNYLVDRIVMAFFPNRRLLQGFLQEGSRWRPDFFRRFSLLQGKNTSVLDLSEKDPLFAERPFKIFLQVFREPMDDNFVKKFAGGMWLHEFAMGLAGYDDLDCEVEDISGKGCFPPAEDLKEEEEEDKKKNKQEESDESSSSEEEKNEDGDDNEGNEENGDDGEKNEEEKEENSEDGENEKGKRQQKNPGRREKPNKRKSKKGEPEKEKPNKRKPNKKNPNKRKPKRKPEVNRKSQTEPQLNSIQTTKFYDLQPLEENQYKTYPKIYSKTDANKLPELASRDNLFRRKKENAIDNFLIPRRGLLLVDEAQLFINPTSFEDKRFIQNTFRWVFLLKKAVFAKRVLFTGTPVHDNERGLDYFKLLNLCLWPWQPRIDEGVWRAPEAKTETTKTNGKKKSNPKEELMIKLEQDFVIKIKNSIETNKTDRNKYLTMYSGIISYLTLENDPTVYPQLNPYCDGRTKCDLFVDLSTTLSKDPKSGKKQEYKIQSFPPNFSDPILKQIMYQMYAIRVRIAMPKKSGTTKKDTMLQKLKVLSLFLQKYPQEKHFAYSTGKQYSELGEIVQENQDQLKIVFVSLVVLMQLVSNFPFPFRSEEGKIVTLDDRYQYIANAWYGDIPEITKGVLELNINKKRLDLSKTKNVQPCALSFTFPMTKSRWEPYAKSLGKFYGFLWEGEYDQQPKEMHILMRDFLGNLALTLFNHPKNCHGKYFNLFLGDHDTREGISLFDTRKVYLLNLDLTPSGYNQAIHRVMRNCRMKCYQDIREWWINVYIFLVSSEIPQGNQIGLSGPTFPASISTTKNRIIPITNIGRLNNKKPTTATIEKGKKVSSVLFKQQQPEPEGKAVRKTKISKEKTKKNKKHVPSKKLITLVKDETENLKKLLKTEEPITSIINFFRTVAIDHELFADYNSSKRKPENIPLLPPLPSSQSSLASSSSSSSKKIVSGTFTTLGDALKLKDAKKKGARKEAEEKDESKQKNKQKNKETDHFSLPTTEIFYYTACPSTGNMGLEKHRKIAREVNLLPASEYPNKGESSWVASKSADCKTVALSGYSEVDAFIWFELKKELMQKDAAAVKSLWTKLTDFMNSQKRTLTDKEKVLFARTQSLLNPPRDGAVATVSLVTTLEDMPPTQKTFLAFVLNYKRYLIGLKDQAYLETVDRIAAIKHEIYQAQTQTMTRIENAKKALLEAPNTNFQETAKKVTIENMADLETEIESNPEKADFVKAVPMGESKIYDKTQNPWTINLQDFRAVDAWKLISQNIESIFKDRRDKAQQKIEQGKYFKKQRTTLKTDPMKEEGETERISFSTDLARNIDLGTKSAKYFLKIGKKVKELGRAQTQTAQKKGNQNEAPGTATKRPTEKEKILSLEELERLDNENIDNDEIERVGYEPTIIPERDEHRFFGNRKMTGKNSGEGYESTIRPETFGNRRMTGKNSRTSGKNSGEGKQVVKLEKRNRTVGEEKPAATPSKNSNKKTSQVEPVNDTQTEKGNVDRVMSEGSKTYE